MLLNLDAGERAGETDGLWLLFDLVNCACGGHAGDAASMDRVIRFCARTRVRLGAHPSYPDVEGFGRRSPFARAGINVPALLRFVTDSVAAQCRTLNDLARFRGVAVVAVKPHGALYHDAASRTDVAEAVVTGAIDALGRGVSIVGPPAGALREATAAHGLMYLREGFADRRLRDDGSLVPRTEDDALIVEPAEAAAQAVALASIVDTLCLHSDTPGVMAIATAVRASLRG